MKHLFQKVKNHFDIMALILNARINKLLNLNIKMTTYVILEIPGTNLKNETNKIKYDPDSIEFNEGFQFPITDKENQSIKFEIAGYQDDKYTPISIIMHIPIKNIPINAPYSQVQQPIMNLQNQVLCNFFAEFSLWTPGPKLPIKAELVKFDFQFAVFILVKVYENTKVCSDLCELGEHCNLGPVDLRSIIEVRVIDMTYQCLTYKVVKIRASSINTQTKDAILEKTVEDKGERIGDFVIRFSITDDNK